MRGFRSLGPAMLPIIKAGWDTGPFLIVVVCPLLGFVHLYYSMGIRGIMESIFMMYRLSFLGDFDVWELEDVDPVIEEKAENDGEKTEWWPFIGLLMVVASFFLMIVMMNILIGVLSESYNNAVIEQEQMFMHERAKIVLDTRLRTNAWDACLSRCFCCSRKVKAAADMVFGVDTNTTGEEEYIWFSWCRDTEFGALDEDDDDTLAEHIAVVKRDIANVEARIMKSMESQRQERECADDLLRKCVDARDQQKKRIDDLQDVMASIDEELTAVKNAVMNSGAHVS